ncbi:MAG: phosphoribosylglycinamide formyltransferase [Candidatus Thermoplasmatota archaeon]|nr:phosphoribosylglycinamide formyltransferase [Candidatus Thermoplasmatota archaeon]
MKRPRIAIMASGRGTDFQAIVDANGSGDVNLNIALLLCNRSDAFVIQRAKDRGIPYVVIDHRGKEREEFDREVNDVLVEYKIELIVLAGFMRVLSRWFVSMWKDRIVNIHPALLPSFPGAQAHRDALEYGVKVTGLTIHFVDEDVDHGPIIFQFPVDVLNDDDEDSLSKRVLEQEHIWYPRVIQWIADGKVTRIGRKVIIMRERPDRNGVDL